MPSKLKDMNPKSLFGLGIVGGFLTLATIGFFIFLGIFLTQKEGSNTLPTSNNLIANTNPTTANTATSDTQETEIKLVAIKDTDHIRGDKNSEITIIEFSDTECPYCHSFHKTMLQVMANYKGKVRWVYKHAPIDRLHPMARTEAEATECAAELGGDEIFWKYLDRVIETAAVNSAQLTENDLNDIAKYVNVDATKFSSCLQSKKYATLVTNQLIEADDAGMQGTPYSVITDGTQKIALPGAIGYENIKILLDQLLAN